MVTRLRRPRFPSSFVGFFDGAVQPHLDQMQHAPINDPARHRLQKVGMRNAPEVVREIGVHDFRMATEQQFLHLYGGLLGVAPSAVGVDFWWKVGFSTSIAAVMQTRSHTVEMPSGLSLPLAFGMNTRLIGSGRYVSSLSASASSASHRPTPCASMSAKSWPSTPGAPLLERHWA